jgi:hypothetical protein
MEIGGTGLVSSTASVAAVPATVSVACTAGINASAGVPGVPATVAVSCSAGIGGGGTVSIPATAVTVSVGCAAGFTAIASGTAVESAAAATVAVGCSAGIGTSGTVVLSAAPVTVVVSCTLGITVSQLLDAWPDSGVLLTDRSQTSASSGYLAGYAYFDASQISGFSPTKRYWRRYRQLAADPGDWSANDIVTFGATVPPTNLVATLGTASDGIHLMWTPPGGEQFSKIYASPGTQFSLATLVASNVLGPPYSDTGAVIGTPENYWVVASNNGYDSLPSNMAVGIRALDPASVPVPAEVESGIACLGSDLASYTVGTLTTSLDTTLWVLKSTVVAGQWVAQGHDNYPGGEHGDFIGGSLTLDPQWLIAGHQADTGGVAGNYIEAVAGDVLQGVAFGPGGSYLGSLPVVINNVPAISNSGAIITFYRGQDCTLARGHAFLFDYLNGSVEDLSNPGTQLTMIIWESVTSFLTAGGIFTTEAQVTVGPTIATLTGILQQSGDNQVVAFEMYHSDTLNLLLGTGNYIYNIEAQFADGQQSVFEDGGLNILNAKLRGETP